MGGDKSNFRWQVVDGKIWYAEEGQIGFICGYVPEIFIDHIASGEMIKFVPLDPVANLMKLLEGTQWISLDGPEKYFCWLVCGGKVMAHLDGTPDSESRDWSDNKKFLASIDDGTLVKRDPIAIRMKELEGTALHKNTTYGVGQPRFQGRAVTFCAKQEGTYWARPHDKVLWRFVRGGEVWAGSLNGVDILSSYTNQAFLAEIDSGQFVKIDKPVKPDPIAARMKELEGTYWTVNFGTYYVKDGLVRIIYKSDSDDRLSQTYDEEHLDRFLSAIDSGRLTKKVTPSKPKRFQYHITIEGNPGVSLDAVGTNISYTATEI
jgi:hypothetical protein